MNIAVIGSWKEKYKGYWKLTDKENFSKACRELGKAIAHKGDSLLVTSDNENTADLYVVDGFIEQIRNIEMSCSKRIYVYRSTDDKPAFKKYYEEYPNCFDFIKEEQRDWILNILLLVEKADTIIVIGGGHKTHVCANAAIIANKKIIPVGSFGGAGREILQKIRNKSEYNNYNIDLQGLDNDWNFSVLRNILNQSLPKMFIVHGHDKQALEDLKRLLKDEFKLETIILQNEPSSGRTIIKKFEEEARKASFAFILLTPDDVVEKVNRIYAQGRPNVIFELGWFYGKIKREKTCILKKENTNIHTDIEGVSTIIFSNKINDCISEIKQELMKAKII
jgi:predicted nucleotide-binding protein